MWGCRWLRVIGYDGNVDKITKISRNNEGNIEFTSIKNALRKRKLTKPLQVFRGCGRSAKRNYNGGKFKYRENKYRYKGEVYVVWEPESNSLER